ncbi:hypothetical protein CpipJ_CPIJ017269 [Culex quinquefasciatus]|uniref:Uncharacterized protein n=1 Tax=Culex quinquefasciatus TaxID=7176 RepID=B0XDN9_CULQU|nr:hypothetical protein CpipJ_CPIJ017269 [Culex quinquefasciatus]|eukprot:XP_001867761.1 hypothetical protein CpipJ_CPIJ017269 [Culex quinquefasciatus]
MANHLKQLQMQKCNILIQDLIGTMKCKQTIPLIAIGAVGTDSIGPLSEALNSFN